MKAVRGKDRILSLISLPESRLYTEIQNAGNITHSELTEYNQRLALEMYAKNILKKDSTGYSCYDQT